MNSLEKVSCELRVLSCKNLKPLTFNLKLFFLVENRGVEPLTSRMQI